MEIALASLGARAGAALDHLLAAVPALGITALLAVLLEPLPVPLIGAGAVLVTTLAYFIWFEARHGATPVKGWLGLRVAKQDGSDIGPRESVLRNLIRPIDFSTLYLTGIGLVLASNRDQRLGDRLAGTIVVEEGTGDTIQQHSHSYQSRAIGYLIAVMGLLPVIGLVF